jgi:hypothetical protein
VLLLLLFALGSPARALADDASPPSLELPSDRARSHDAIALTVDPVAAIFGEYGPRLGFAFGAYQALWGTAALERRFGGYGAGLELTYEVRPMGRGLEGVEIGVSLAAGYFPGAAPKRALRAALEVGYTYVWGRVFLGAAAGVARHRVWPAQALDRHPWGLLVRAQLGYAFF